MSERMSCTAWVKDYIRMEVGDPLQWEGYLKNIISGLEHDFVETYQKKQRLLNKYTDEDYAKLYELGVDPIQDLDDKLKSIETHIDHLSEHISALRSYDGCIDDIKRTCDRYIAEEKKGVKE